MWLFVPWLALAQELDSTDEPASPLLYSVYNDNL